MNNFCKNLRDFLREEFKIEVEVFILKKKKLVYVFGEPLMSHKFFKDIINFSRKYWNMRKRFYPG